MRAVPCLLAAALLAAGVASTVAGTEVPPPAAATAESPGTRLVVRVSGVEPRSGRVGLALYDSAEAYRAGDGAVRKGFAEVDAEGIARWSVESLPPGLYAVAAYLDRNGNGELDRNRLRAPKEPYGFSNDVRGVFGPPAFEEACFTLEPAGATIEITLR